MITPRRTRLLRVPGLREFRAVLSSLPREAIVVVPTRAAAAQLPAPLVGVTRDELYDLLHARLASPPRRLTSIERDVIAQAAARAAAPGPDTEPLTFQLRPGLVAEMLRFYDQLRRQGQQVTRFEELITAALGSGEEDFEERSEEHSENDEIDRGARRMRRQTRFLAAAFRGYEARARQSNACDEHLLRARLIAEPAAEPVPHIAVTVGDWIADDNGLFVADFDLLARIPGLQSIDIIATESLLRSGFHERLHRWLPGIEEVECGALDAGRPRLIVPAAAANDDLWWTLRDREEELVAIARRLKADARDGEAVPLDRVAVVFKRPLPYLYLADEVFGGAGIPFRAFDALPLAAEPTAAAIDLVLEAVSANFTRDVLVALLRSPHLLFVVDDAEVSPQSVSRLDRALSDFRYLGDAARLETLADSMPAAAAPAFRAALTAAQTLAPLGEPAPASVQVERLLTFWTSHLRPIEEAHAQAPRERRARSAIAETLAALGAVHAAHDDPPWRVDDLALAVRRWIGEQTFETEPSAASTAGIRLLDDTSARFGAFDDLAIVGLVETEWPERQRRNIFYPPAVLKSLGWPSEQDRRAAADARLLDLVASAARRVTLSTFTLEDDALVSRSLQLDEIPRLQLSAVAAAPSSAERVFVEEALSLDPVALESLDAGAKSWAELRLSRSGADDVRFHGVAPGSPSPTAAAKQPFWSVSALETYLGCPFRFFAQHVLRLEEEPDDEEVMDPRRQGQFVHEVFEQFFREWQGAGHRAVTADNLDDARALFADVVDRAVERLPEAEAGLERTRLLGSPAAAGLGEAVLRMEVERRVPVVERLLEHRLEGRYVFNGEDGPRTVALRGKADRLDLLSDGTFRVIDYKLGWPPDRSTALQLPIYALCAEQQLAARGRAWTLGEAAYIAFKGPRRIVPLFKGPDDRDEVLTKAQQRLVATFDKIAAGEFPPTPDDVYRCETCAYARVCRKDYVGDV